MRIRPDLDKAVRLRADETGRTLTAIYEEAVERYLGMVDTGAESCAIPSGT